MNLLGGMAYKIRLEGSESVGFYKTGHGGGGLDRRFIWLGSDRTFVFLTWTRSLLSYACRILNDTCTSSLHKQSAFIYETQIPCLQQNPHHNVLFNNVLHIDLFLYTLHFTSDL